LAGSSPAAILTLSLSPFTVLALLRRLLLLPLLAPLLVALLLAALNPRPSLSLRLLIWRTPQLPIGLWIGAGASGGAILSAAAAALALRQGQASQRPNGRRRQGLAAESPEPWEEQPRRSPVASWFARSQQGFAATPPDSVAPGPTAASQGLRSRGSAGPQRAPGEPAPTVAVPFRVLHRPGGPNPPAAQAPPQPGATVHSGPQAQAEPMAVGDDWGQNEADDW
jgi:hypothetical protein